MASPPPALTALVDTFVPGSEGHIPYPPASVLGVDRDVAELVANLPEAPRHEFESLLRAVESPWVNLLLTGRPRRFTRLTPAAREEYLLGWSRSRLAVKRKGFQAAKRLATWFCFSARTSDGRNPLWDRIHYEPPALPNPPATSPSFAPTVPDRDEELSADVCVIGSGAGGGVLASRVAAAGYRVVVLEAGDWVTGLAYPRASGRDSTTSTSAAGS